MLIKSTIKKQKNPNSFFLEGKITKSFCVGPRQAQAFAFEGNKKDWVLTTGSGEERFLGYLYLVKALAEKQSEIEKAGIKLKVAKTRMYNQGGSVFYLSRYVEGKRPSVFGGLSEAINILNSIGYRDTLANIYQCSKEGKNKGIIFVYDTEKSSFDKEVWNEKIATDDAIEYHKELKTTLLEKSNSSK